ncbi:hypothetical protein, partial [Enterococcus faecium]|uniref:hypothetical protein n=1 Tax=Enterococcus faecium TaxID=1352 RepID=UPI000C02053B
MEQFLNEKITEAKREVDRLTHVCQTKPFDSADFFENEFQIERLAAQIEAVSYPLLTLPTTHPVQNHGVTVALLPLPLSYTPLT